MDLFQEMELRQQMLLEQRQHYLIEAPIDSTLIKKPNFIQRLLAPKALGYWGSRPVIFDWGGSYNKPNFTLLKNRITLGVPKMVEVDDTAGPNSFLAAGFADSVQGLYDAGGGCVPFVFHHCGAYWLNSGFTMKGVSDLDAGTGDARVATYLNPTGGDPEIRAIVRQIFIGNDWTTNPGALKTMPHRVIHGIMIDVERWWRSYTDWYVNKGNAKQIEDPWIGFSAKILHDRLQWMMDHFYLPSVPIIFYSGKWFLNQYATSLGSYLGDKDTIPAIWYFTKGTNTTIEDISAVYMNQMPDNWTSTVKANLFGNPVAIQIGANFIVPEFPSPTGTPATVDVSGWISPTPIKDYFQIKAPPPPVPTCSTGQHWDPTANGGQGACVPDVIPPAGDWIPRVSALEGDIKALRDGLKPWVNK